MKIFGKYGTEDVEIRDQSLRTVVYFGSASVHTFGRHQKRQHGKFKINIVERLVNKLMRGGTGEKTSGKVIRTKGRLQGKKLRMIKAVEDAFRIVHEKTNSNPVQVLVKALENSAPREDV
ncbi:MAG TPA: 30S ribosomal protein S7, partial [Candidatus Bilamarchaeaceae archaeon]|nr:30S ribosomal protein S7 [Candidatus Bilamarchaeaceae archaeon]